MQIETRPLSDLQPAPYNPRIALRPGDAAYERLRRSLDEFDLVQPIVWNRRTGHVVGGHQRLTVLRAEGRTEVECVVVDLPLEREQALNVALNNDKVAGDWDVDKLQVLLADLLNVPEFDATLTGFDEQELHDLLLSPDAEAGFLDAAEESESHPAGHVTATLEIPPDRWPSVRDTLDGLLAAEVGVELHVVQRGVRG